MTKAKGTERDVSAKDGRWLHDACGHRHRPGALCPRPLIWLVASICTHCRADGTYYCPDHNAKGGSGWRG